MKVNLSSKIGNDSDSKAVQIIVAHDCSVQYLGHKVVILTLVGSSVCFQFPLIVVAVAFYTSKTESWQREVVECTPLASSDSSFHTERMELPALNG